MLLQSVVAELDRHLARLFALREIVAGLENTPAAIRNLPISLPVLSKSETDPTIAPKSLIKLRKVKILQHASSPKKKVTVNLGPLVMSRSIPAGPVVVSPRQLAEERERRQMTQTQTAIVLTDAPMDLEEMSRSLSVRWFIGPVQ